jgi:hypothetical protein
MFFKQWLNYGGVGTHDQQQFHCITRRANIEGMEFDHIITIGEDFVGYPALLQFAETRLRN